MKRVSFIPSAASDAWLSSSIPQRCAAKRLLFNKDNTIRRYINKTLSMKRRKLGLLSGAEAKVESRLITLATTEEQAPAPMPHI